MTTETISLIEVTPPTYMENGITISTQSSYIKAYAYEGDFPSLYQKLVRWSKEEILLDLTIPKDLSGFILVVPEVVKEDPSTMSRYFSYSAQYKAITLNSAAIFDLDGDITYNYLYRNILATKEITNIIKRYDLQKAIGKLLKTAFHMGMSCPVLLVKNGTLCSVSFGGEDSLSLTGIHEDSPCSEATALPVISALSAYYNSGSSTDFANNFILLKPNHIQISKLVIKAKDESYRLYYNLSREGKKSYAYNHLLDLTTLARPADMAFLIECCFSIAGFVGSNYRSSIEFKGSKGTPIFIDKSKLVDANLLEITEDFCSFLVEIFGPADSTALITNDSFFCDKDIYRTEKKTDSSRYTREEFGPLFVLRKSTTAKELTENKSYSNFIRKAMYPLENLVAACVFYEDAKMSADKTFDTNIQVMGNASPGSLPSIHSSTLTDYTITQIINTIVESHTIDRTIIERLFPKFKTNSTMSKYKEGLFSVCFLQSYGRTSEKRFLSSIMSHLNTKSCRLFKSEKDFYLVDVVRALYHRKDNKGTFYKMAAEFYSSNCTPCVPELDALVAAGATDPAWTVRCASETASVDISTVFSLSLANVDMLKKVISCSRASEYKEFLTLYGVALETTINNLDTSKEAKANLLFALRFLTKWTEILTVSEQSFIKDNPLLTE